MCERPPCGSQADLVQYDEPVWAPLLEVLGERLTGSFMWMQEARLDGGRALHGYKHIFTRRYLYLSETGDAFERTPCGRYVPQRLDFAIEQALCFWWLLGSIEDEDAEAIRDAYDRANRVSSRPP